EAGSGPGASPPFPPGCAPAHPPPRPRRGPRTRAPPPGRLRLPGQPQRPGARTGHRRTGRPPAHRLRDTGHMMRIAITGHRGLPTATERLVDRAIRQQLAAYPGSDLVGISNLADGADQLFARAVLDAGGQLDVIIPAAKYRDGLPEDVYATYDALLSRVTSVHRLDRIESTEDAHMAASQAMLHRADRLFAVWDGKPARGY